jgi:putative flippase GtrA
MKSWWLKLDLRMEEKKPELWKFLKWNMVGLVTTVLDLGVYYFMMFALFSEAYRTAPIGGPIWLQSFLSAIGLDEGLGTLYAFLVSITLGYVAAFILNRKIAFKANNNAIFASVIYVVNVVVVIITGSWFGTWFTMFLLEAGWNTVLVTLAVKPLQLLIPMIWAYPLNRFIVFAQKKDKTNATITDAATESAEAAAP